MHREVIYLDEEEDLGPQPITWDQLRGMKDMAAYYLLHGTKKERRLARRLAHAAAWIEAEAKAIGNRYEGVIAIDQEIQM